MSNVQPSDREIVQRVPGYSNEMMRKDCEIMYDVLTKTKDVVVGRGKSAKVEKVLAYPKSAHLIEKMERSIEYYSRQEDPKPKVQFRDYQLDIISRGSRCLKTLGFLYLAMEVRTGKTLTSLGIAESIGVNNVLFVTKLKAISSIQRDYDMLAPSFMLHIINYESLHTIDKSIDWDMIILDEAHSMGAFPKPSKRAFMVKSLLEKHKPYCILLSGTPTPESYSQMYHQVFGIQNNPFNKFPNFYKFASEYVNVKQKKVNGMYINDYSRGRESILEKMEPYTISYSQKEAGFVVQTDEQILEVEMSKTTYAMIKKLKRDLVIEGREEVILADTPVKLMMKIHQLCSGTIKFESGNSMVTDDTKAMFIKKNFGNKKIGIFYKFKEELACLQAVFGSELTTDLHEFETTDKSIALQIVSGREGISLKQADCLVYYNIDFSATSYWQSRDRMTTKDRLHNKIYWIFAKDGIEYDIHDAVSKKKDYTINHFKKGYEKK